jgi:hypothetical protein
MRFRQTGYGEPRMDRVQRIRERAFQLWMLEGRPERRALAHWEEAERQVEAELHAEVRRPDAGTNELPAADMVAHQGPTSGSALSGFEQADGISTPVVPPRRNH